MGKGDQKLDCAMQIKIGFFDIICAEDIWKNLSLETLKKHRTEMAKKIIKISREEDLQRCFNSNSLSLYPGLADEYLTCFGNPG